MSKLALMSEPTLVPPKNRDVSPIKYRDVLNHANLGLLPEPEFSWKSFGTSTILNVLCVAVFLILSAASAKIIETHNEQVVLLAPVPISEPPKPVAKFKPPPPVIEHVTPPKIALPKQVELPKPLPVLVKLNQPPVPNLPPAPPRRVTPPPAPKAVSINAAAASVPNHATVSSPVSLGDPNALKADPNSKRPTQAVALGLAGMPAGNTGEGKAGATHIELGSGSPTSGSMNGRSAGSVTHIGLNNGVPGGTGDTKSTGKTAAVALGVNNTPPPPQPAQVTHGAMTNVVVTYKPPSVYTEEAKSLHIEGTVDIEVVFLASGRVQVVRVLHGLGHGLDESAVRSAEGIRFKPAMQDGHAVDQHTTVHIEFQLS